VFGSRSVEDEIDCRRYRRQASGIAEVGFEWLNRGGQKFGTPAESPDRVACTGQLRSQGNAHIPAARNKNSRHSLKKNVHTARFGRVETR